MEVKQQAIYAVREGFGTTESMFSCRSIATVQLLRPKPVFEANQSFSISQLAKLSNENCKT